ncbi:MAG: hypothetical protein ACTSQD_07915 [Promethearchaeota archaeon]
MKRTNIPKQIENSEEENCNCYCGCLSGKEKDEKLEEKDFKLTDL